MQLESALDATLSAAVAVLFIAGTTTSAPISHGAAGRSTQQNRGVVHYYVAPNGKDSNPGTLSAPWASIQHAASAVVPGSTVEVAPGTYMGPFVTTKSGAPNAHIRFISSVRWGAQLKAYGGMATWQNTGDYVDIIGFDITGAHTHQGIWERGAFGNIAGNHVHNIAVPCDANGGAGINSEGVHTTIKGNVVHDIGLWGSLCNGIHGVYVSRPKCVVENNVVYRIPGAAINMYHTTAAEGIIVNNTVFNSGAQAGKGVCYGAGIAIGGANNKHTIVENNILRDIHCWAIDELDSARRGNKYINNLLFNNVLAIHAAKGTVAGTIERDPLFVNYVADGGGDYHLTPTSPAVNHGEPERAPMTDIDGGVRPTGRGVDIGAYEFGAPAKSWPWF